MEQFLGLVYTVCFSTCIWPQIIKSLRTKKVEDVSISLFILSIIGYVAAISYTLLRVGFDFWWLINYFLSLLSAIIMTVLWFKYKDKE
tara:strand:+ start:292 stop:555 length:264 start_codon:yes stop_codon:yes gene_type:complete